MWRRSRDYTTCAKLADDGVYLQRTTIDYDAITPENCATLTTETNFYQFTDDTSYIDESTLASVQWITWLDVVNAFVWLIVVFLIEVEVWLQSEDRFDSRALNPVRQVKTISYLVLIGNCVIWGLNGYYLYCWDAFLWIFGFWAIELNLAEWEQDRKLELQTAAT